MIVITKYQQLGYIIQFYHVPQYTSHMIIYQLYFEYFFLLKVKTNIIQMDHPYIPQNSHKRISTYYSPKQWQTCPFPWIWFDSSTNVVSYQIFLIWSYNKIEQNITKTIEKTPWIQMIICGNKLSSKKGNFKWKRDNIASIIGLRRSEGNTESKGIAWKYL